MTGHFGGAVCSYFVSVAVELTDWHIRTVCLWVVLEPLYVQEKNHKTLYSLQVVNVTLCSIFAQQKKKPSIIVFVYYTVRWFSP